MHASLIIFYIAWFLLEIFLKSRLRSTITDKYADQNTLAIIWKTVGITLAVSIFFARRTSFPLYENLSFQYLGAILALIGMGIRTASIVSLGQNFTVDVTIRENHTLKMDGIYALIRHPSYTGLLLSFAGLAFSVNNWVSFFMITSVVFTLFLRRIKIEETVLAKHFGAEYLCYQNRTKKLVPFVF